MVSRSDKKFAPADSLNMFLKNSSLALSLACVLSLDPSAIAETMPPVKNIKIVTDLSIDITGTYNTLAVMRIKLIAKNKLSADTFLNGIQVTIYTINNITI